MPLILCVKNPLCLLAVLFFCSQPAEARVEIQNYNTQTAAETCQLSTCELLLKELGAMQEKMEELESKLQANNYEIGELKEKSRDQGLEIQTLRRRSNVSEAQVRANNNEIEDLKEESRVRPKVAFAAALGDGGHVGPSNTENTLAFRKVLTNVGNAYNPSSGIFTVPVKGAYYVSFSTFTRANSEKHSCVSLFRNDQRLLTACDHASDDYSDSAGNGATLLLEKDDHVYVTLHAHSMVFDDYHNRSCFRGFLIFQM